MPRPRPKKLDKNDKAAIERPFYFLSYSTGEPQIGLFVECLEIVFRDHFTLERVRERGQLRLSRREKWVKFFERYPEARELYPKAASAVARREKSKA